MNKNYAQNVILIIERRIIFSWRFNQFAFVCVYSLKCSQDEHNHNSLTQKNVQEKVGFISELFKGEIQNGKQIVSTATFK